MARSGPTVIRDLWRKAVIGPRSFREADACVIEHSGETGIVLAMRFGYGHGCVPHREWREARLTVDGHIVCTASVSSHGARWVRSNPVTTSSRHTASSPIGCWRPARSAWHPVSGAS